MRSRIFYTKPSIGKLEEEFVSDAIRNGWGQNCYGYVDKFEADFKKHLGVRFAISTSSCTGALHMGLTALGIGRGDEVILADTNWIATVAPITYLTATPIFVDILKESWCIDPKKVLQSITKKTKAIIATHLYGNLCDMKHLMEIGDKYNIPVIEDAAEALGSMYRSKRAGSIGRFGVFSFHGSKTLTTGEGGMFVTNDENLYEKVLTLSNHGRSYNQHKQFWADCVGYKYKMSNIQAALGCAQLQRINELVSKKREILKAYKNSLSSKSALTLNVEEKDNINGAWMPTVVYSEESNVSREMIQEVMKKSNIDARVFFWPLSDLPMFKSHIENKNAKSISSRAINLPSFHDMTSDEIDRVSKVVLSLLEHRR